jgi:hypothetical protein
VEDDLTGSADKLDKQPAELGVGEVWTEDTDVS